MCWIALLRTCIPNLRCANLCGEELGSEKGCRGKGVEEGVSYDSYSVDSPQKEMSRRLSDGAPCERSGDERKGERHMWIFHEYEA